jgi:hypothetical protein
MPDNSKPDSNAPDTQVPAIAPTTDDLRRLKEMAAMQKILAQHDSARAKAPRITMVCTAPFTLVTDNQPQGVVVNRGDEFEISSFDLHRYVGRSFPKQLDPATGRPQGVTIEGVSGPSVDQR